MPVEIALEDNRWTALDLQGLADRACAATLARLSLDPDACEIALLACDDARIAALNADFRGKPAPTNVLSWPTQDLAADDPGAVPLRPVPDFTGDIPLGDIALSWDTCAGEAQSAGKPMADHVAHLIVHGLLHLLGYDHIRDPDATLMQGLESGILGKMGIDDPYNEDYGS